MNQKRFDDVVLAIVMVKSLVYHLHFHFDLVDGMNPMVVGLVHLVIQLLIQLFDNTDEIMVEMHEQLDQQYVSIVLMNIKVFIFKEKKIGKPVLCRPGISLRFTSAKVVSDIGVSNI